MNAMRIPIRRAAVATLCFVSSQLLAQIPSVPGVTGNAENLSRETSDASQKFFARVSPDGKFLLYNALETSYSLGLSNGQLAVKPTKISALSGRKLANPLRIRW